MPFLKDNTAQITKNIWAFNCWHFASKRICDDTNVDTILIHSRETKQNICDISSKRKRGKERKACEIRN